MGRAQETSVADIAGGQNATFNKDAQDSYTAEQGDIGDYQSQLSKFAAANPYGAGGAYQTSVNQATAGTADAGSDAAKEAAQAAAVRAGGNAGAGVAAGTAASEANTRNLMTTQAKANADRINQGAGYGDKVLQASSIPASLQNSVTSTAANAGNNALAIDQKASDQPTFWDTFGEQAAGALGKGLGKGASAGIGALISGCWIASEVFEGGWFDPRTVDVRRWLFGSFRATWYGLLITDFYLWSGKWIAKQIRRFPFLRRIFLPLFNVALAKAREGRNG